MEIRLLELAVLQLGLSLFLGMAILYLTYQVVRKVLAKRYQITEHNTSFSIFLSAILFSVGYIVSSVIEPLLSTFRMLTGNISEISTLILEFSKYLLFFFSISTLIALIINAIGVTLFTRLTHINEFEEIKKNNVSVAITTAAIIIVMTLFAKDGVVFLLESIVPYPSMPTIN
jgi:uncharacterized membrane protein YjfL (UPF0719 family)